MKLKKSSPGCEALPLGRTPALKGGELHFLQDRHDYSLLKNFFLPMLANPINTMPIRSMAIGSGLGRGKPKEATVIEKPRGAISRINKKINKRKLKRFKMHLINNKLFCEKIYLTNQLYLIESN